MTDQATLPVDVARANTQHHMVITMDALKPDEQAEYDAGDDQLRREIDRDRRNISMECPGVTSACEGWIECQEDHPEDLGEDTDVAHGVEHQHFWFGWGVETGQCSLSAFPDSWIDSATDIADYNKLGPGRYPIDSDWDEEYATVTLITPEPPR